MVADLICIDCQLTGQEVLRDENDYRVKVEEMVGNGWEEGSKLNLMGVVGIKKKEYEDYIIEKGNIYFGNARQGRLILQITRVYSNVVCKSTCI